MSWTFPEIPSKADWGLLAAVGLSTTIGGALAGFNIPVHFAGVAALSVLTFVTGARLTARREMPVFAHLLGLTAWALISGPIMACGSYVFPATNLPLIDDSLAQVDALLGVHAQQLVLITGASPLLAKASLIAYSKTALLLFLGVGLLFFTRDYARISKTISLLTIGMVATLVIATLFPAVGAYAHYGIGGSDLGALAGTGVGTWHIPDFVALREGTLRTFPVTHWQGLVTFPSFHTIYALVGAYAFAGHRWLKWPAQIFAGFVLFTTIPIGGHYLADVLGGVAIYAASLAWIERPRRGIVPARELSTGPTLVPA